MPDSKDSIMWTNEFMGETVGGSVAGGPFREWRTLEGLPRIRRAVGAKGKLFSEDEIRFMLNQRDISQVLAFTAPKPGCPFQPNFNVLEYSHGNPHIYVGGEMFEQATAANDPVFFMHHSFVDYIWRSIAKPYRAGPTVKGPGPLTMRSAAVNTTSAMPSCDRFRR